jgi:hypothetical protein
MAESCEWTLYAILQDLPRIVRITRRIRHQLHEKCYFRLIDEHNVRGPPRYSATVGRRGS